ncbi:MAG: glycerophosphodiester phosphodiesterase [Opitutales bacterium]|nr:glycerophosphodiester phosphodiesterase [Opitutales bacterium]
MRILLKTLLCIFLLLDPAMIYAEKDEFWIIAHRGASGHLPEHTLIAKALAYGMGAHAIEQDLVSSKDGILFVLHDIHIDTTTDVVGKFPGRAREDRRYYAIDFTAAELKQLNVFERFRVDSGAPVYPERFKEHLEELQIPTFAEEIRLIQELNRTTGKRIWIYPEIKAPRFHRDSGIDISKLTLDTLSAHGLLGEDAPVFLQCFDQAETLRIRKKLGYPGKLVQLIAENSWNESGTDYDRLKSPGGLDSMAPFIDGIGPWYPQCLNEDGSPSLLVQHAKKLGLTIHPFTFRADQYPEDTFPSFAAFVMHFKTVIQVDGIFTDHPSFALEALADR